MGELIKDLKKMLTALCMQNNEVSQTLVYYVNNILDDLEDVSDKMDELQERIEELESEVYR